MPMPRPSWPRRYTTTPRPAAVANDVGDGDQQEPVLLGEALELLEASHAGLVLADDLAQHARGIQAGHAGEVEGGLGVATALEDAAFAIAKGKGVAGSGQV